MIFQPLTDAAWITMRCHQEHTDGLEQILTHLGRPSRAGAGGPRPAASNHRLTLFANTRA